MPLHGPAATLASHHTTSLPKSDAATSAHTKPHIAPQRQSSGEVAREHGVKRSEIIRANPRLNHQPNLAPGDKIDIPQREDARAKRHQVEGDETPKKIADKYGIPERALREENGLEPYQDVHPSEELNIPDSDDARDDRGSGSNWRNTLADHLERSAANDRVGQRQDTISTASERTDAAAERVVETMLLPPGALKLLPPGERDEMIADANRAKAELDTAVKAEIEARTSATSYLPVNADQLRNGVVDAIRSRMTGTPEQAAINVSLGRIEIERQTELNKTPIDRAQERTDAAAVQVEATQLLPPEEMRNLPQGEQADMRASANAAQAELDSAVKAEIALTANTTSYLPISADDNYFLAVNSVNTRIADSPHVGVISESVQSARVDRTLDIASRQDPAAGLQTVNTLLASLPAEKQDSLLLDDRVEAVVTRAADQANQPLADFQQRVENSDAGPYGFEIDNAVSKSVETVNTMTVGLDPRLTALVADKETANINTMFGVVGFDKDNFSSMEQSAASLSVMAGRTFGASNSEAVIDKIIGLGGDPNNWNEGASLRAIAEQGAGPALSIRLGELRGYGEEQQAYLIREVAYQVESYSQNYVGSAYEDLVKVNEELAWLIANPGAAMTPEQLDLAIKDYIKDHPEFEEQSNAALRELANRGEVLTNQLAQLQQFSSEAGVEDTVLPSLEKIAGDPGSKSAIQAAVDANPELLTGEKGLLVIDVLGKTKDIWNSEGGTFVEDMASKWIFNSLQKDLAGFDINNPLTYPIAKEKLTALADSRVAYALGLDQDQFKGYLDDFSHMLSPESDASATSVRSNLDTFLGKLESGDLSSSTHGALARMGQTFAVVGFLGSAGQFADDPTLLNGINTIVQFGDAASAFKIPGDIGKAVGSKAFGTLIGGAQTLIGGIQAYSAFKEGDYVGSGLIATGAVGTGLITASSAGWIAGAWAGPVGIALVAVSVIGLAQWDRIQESNKHMNETTAEFMQFAGFSVETAYTLYDQSGEGYNTVPLIMAYGEAKGMSREETVKMIDEMSPQQLVKFRDALHHTLDACDGDISKLTKQGPSPLDNYWEELRNSDDVPDGLILELLPPTSVRQIDALLENITRNVD